MKVKKTVNEAIEEIALDPKTYDVVNHTYADAIRQSKKNKEHVEDVMKKQAKNAVVPERQPKTIKSDLLKRMHLSESLFESIEEAPKKGKQMVWEAKKKKDDEKWNKDISDKPHSMTAVLSARVKDLNACKTRDELVKLVKEIFEENGIDTKASQRLITNMESKKSFGDALFTLWNSIMSGTGNAVVETLKEAAEPLEEPEDESDWYDMQSLIQDMFIRPDTTRTDEFPKRTLYREFGKKGVHYTRIGVNGNKVIVTVPVGKENEDTGEVILPTSADERFKAKSEAVSRVGSMAKLCDIYKLAWTKDTTSNPKFCYLYITLPIDSVGQVYCVGDYFKEQGLNLEDFFEKSYLLRLAKREQLFANPDDCEEYMEDNGGKKAKRSKKEGLQEDLKYGQTKYDELVGKIREYWDAPAIDNLCELMKDLDEQAAYDLIYKCAEFLEEHADEDLEDSQRYPIESPFKKKDSQFVKAAEKAPVENALLEKDKVTESVVMNEEAKLITSLEDYVPWGGAAETWDIIVEEDKVQALDGLLEEMYPEGLTVTQLNDILWFESDFVFDNLGIDYDEE